MTSIPGPSEPSGAPPRPWLVRGLVGAILLAHVGLALDVATRQSPTYDESPHVARGYSIWASGDYRLDPIHPPLTNLLLACPAWAVPARVDLESDAWREASAFRFGGSFFYDLGNDVMRIIVRARTVVAVLSALLGLVVFAWSRHLFGTAGGLLSLVLYAACPNVLAHASLATTDLATTAFFLCAVGASHLAFVRITPWRVLLACLAVAVLHAATLRALYAWPMLAILVAARVLSHEPLRIGRAGRERLVVARPRRAAVLGGVLAAQALAVVLGLWTVYGLRYSSFAEDEPGRRLHSQTEEQAAADSWENVYRDAPLAEAVVEPLRTRRLLPEAWLYGIPHAIQDSRASETFLDGQISKTGFLLFFPKAFLYKTPLATMGLLGAAAVVGLGIGCGRGTGPRRIRAALERTAPLWALLLVYSAAVIPSTLQLGIRYLLPIYPALFVLAGAAAALVVSERRALRAMVPVLVLALAVTTARARPHFLAFFNTIGGGSTDGHHHLVDSSLDWGQELIALAEWLDEEAPGERVYLSYFGTAQPEYFGIDAWPLPHPWWSRTGDSVLEPGLYCISATHLQQVFLLGTTKWTGELEAEYRRLQREMEPFERLPLAAPSRGAMALARGRAFATRFTRFQGLRFGRLTAWLRDRAPHHSVGGSILAWRLDAQDIHAALEGPPPGGPGP